MRDFDSATGVLDPPDELFKFEVTDVTGTRQFEIKDIAPGVPVGAIAKTIAARMSLPENTPYGLHDSRGAALDDERPIADQIKPGENVTVVPKAHLG